VKTKIDKLFRAISAISNHQIDMPAQQVLVLLAIARQPGINTTELRNAIGISQSSVSRNKDALGAARRDGNPGLGFIREEPCKIESRRLVYFLTPSGFDVVSNAVEALS
jgi:DNA-binding MarR family transcriptional regulator